MFVICLNSAQTNTQFVGKLNNYYHMSEVILGIESEFLK